ncbi:MAG: TonB-dependent receptor [Planctomycetota bacterium]
MTFLPISLLLALAALPGPSPVRTAPHAGAGTEADAPDLTALSLEELLQVEVISVSRKPQTVPSSPAGVYVITQEDIRRSGHSSIPELLRMAPGVHVARINSSSWAVSARGFNGRFNNKMLVMIDGRTVFNNLFSGVFWDVQDVPLSDIERIEVIHGPGGTMWGANAVNGVINIITKSAEDTQGQELRVRVGNEDRGIVTSRYGSTFGENGYWRAYGKWFSRDASQALGGGDHPDPWSVARGGFRTDWTEDERDSFTVQGDFYDGRVREIDTVTAKSPPPDQIFKGTFDISGGNLLGRWRRQVSERSQTQLQVYLDLTRRVSELYDDERNTLDVDFQHRFEVNDTHELMWGLAYRLIESKFDGSTNFDLDQSRRSDQRFGAFIQDEMTLIEDKWSLTVGSKFEHNDFTGFEVQPSIRTLWQPGEAHTVWGAVSRAVRTPSVVQNDLVHKVAETTGPASVVSTVLIGNDDLGADELTAYEVGWRFQAGDRAYFDLTGFYNDFSAADNFTVGSTMDLGGGEFVVPVFFDNAREAKVVGGEIAVDVVLSDAWRVRSGLGLLDLEFEGDVVGTPIQPRSDAEEPNYIANLRSYWAVCEELDIDLGFYAVDDLDDFDVDGYLRVDARVAYRPSDSLEVVLGAQNVTDPQHQEFASALLSTASEIERSVYLDVTWRP